MKTDAKILVAGCGSAGSRHARNLASVGIRGLSLYDPDYRRATSLASELGGGAYESLESALDAGCDAVIVATPPGSHALVTATAIAAGAHVLVEKPLSSSLHDAQEIVAMAESKNLVLMAAYNLRFLPALKKLHKVVESGELGRIMAVHAQFGQYLPSWRPGTDYRRNYIASAREEGGIILEESHEFDYVMWLAGGVSTVYCASGNLSDLEMESEDSAFVTMRHRNGIVSTIRVDCAQRGYRRGALVTGTDGTIEWDVARGIERTDRDGNTVAKRLDTDFAPTYVEELKTFLRCLDGIDDPPVTGRDALEVLRVTFAARESARTGKEIHL